jgi:hypothetical protein
LSESGAKFASRWTGRARFAVAVVAVLVVLVAAGACGDDDATEVSAQAANEPLFGASPRAYELREIDGDAYEGASAAGADNIFTSDLRLVVGPVPAGTSFPPGLTLATACGFWSAHDAEIGEAQIVVRSTSTQLHERNCSESQWQSADRVVAVLTSNPQFVFDGSRLSIEGDGTTLGFERYVPDTEALTEKARTDALAMAEAEGRSAQADVLRGGVPSLDDYKAAMQRTIDCALDAGVDVSAPDEPAPGGLPGYRWSGDMTAHDRCYDEHFRYIDRVYQASLES